MRISMLAVAVAVAACQSSLDTTRTPDSYASFGAAIYREGCQRLAYTGQLVQREAGAITHVDVSGSLGRSVCVAGESPPVGAPPKLFAIVGEHPEIVELVDVVLPKSFLDTLETFLERILPVYDDGTMERAITGLGSTLAVMADDPALPPALARLSVRRGYRPTSPGLVEAVVQYPGLDPFVGSFLGLVGPGGAAEADWRALLAAGSIAAKTATAEPDPAAKDRTLRLAVDLLLTSHPEHPELAQGTPLLAVSRDVRGLAQVAVDDSGALVTPFVDVDRDGLADVDGAGRFLGADGAPLAVPPPFPEFGAADSAPRDALGRALTGPGETTTLYRYIDLDGTLLSGAAREAPVLLDANNDTALGFAWGGQALIGPRKTQTRSYTGPGGSTDSITFNGFDTTQSPALDLLHGFVQLAGAPNPDSVLASAATLLENFESPTSRAVAAMLDTSDRGKQHVEAQVPATSTIFDDLIPLVARTLRVPGLAQDLITALQDPHVRGLAPMIARMMTATNQIDFDHTISPSGAPNDLVGSLDPILPVDRSQPDADYNRSLMQRIAHLVHDSNGRRFCNKAGASAFGQSNIPACGLFQIDDLALFYALNMASRSVIDDRTRAATTRSKASFREQSKGIAKTLIADTDLGDTFLSGTIGITGFTRFPTPKALNRALFLNTDPQNPDPGASAFLRNTAAPITCTDEDRFIDVHNKSIFAWELPQAENGDTFYDAVRPLIDAFAKHDECLAFDANRNCTSAQNAVKIFVDLLSALHEHWASPRSSYFGHTYQSTDRTQPRFAFPDNVVSFEPLLAEVLTNDLVPSLLDLAPTLDTFTVDGASGGQRALPILIDAMRYVFDPQVAPASLVYRSGAKSTVQADGHTPVPQVTPFYLLADGFAGKRAVFAALSATPDGAAQVNKWKSAVSILIDEILTVDHVGDRWQFRNRRIHAITQLLIRFLRERITAHAASGDFESWVRHDLTSDITDKLAGPVVAALSDLAARLEHDDMARSQFYALLNYFTDETVHHAQFQTALTLLADQLQLFLDDQDLVPVAHALGTAMDPDKGVVAAGTALIKRSHDYDTDRALLTILHSLYQPGSRGPLWVSDLADIVSELNRGSPGHGGDLDANDERTLLGELAGFLNDNQRGFMRFVEIVKNRSAK